MTTLEGTPRQEDGDNRNISSYRQMDSQINVFSESIGRATGPRRERRFRQRSKLTKSRDDERKRCSPRDRAGSLRRVTGSRNSSRPAISHLKLRGILEARDSRSLRSRRREPTRARTEGGKGPTGDTPRPSREKMREALFALYASHFRSAMSSFDFRRESTRRFSLFGKDLARLPPRPADGMISQSQAATRAPVLKSEQRDDESRNARIGEVIRYTCANGGALRSGED